jgi:hypothetical protein
MSFTIRGITFSGDNIMADRITTDETVVVSVTPMTGQDPPQPANVDGDVLFVDESGLGTFTQIDALSARYTPNGTPGAARFVAVADADMDDGETRELRASGVLEIILPEDEATTLQLTIGDPEPR